MTSLAEMAVQVLTTADGRAKTALGRAHAATWRAARAAGTPLAVGHATPPDRPARPEKPELLPPPTAYACAHPSTAQAKDT